MSSLTLNTTNGAINLVPADGSGTQTLNIGRQPNLGKVLQVVTKDVSTQYTSTSTSPIILTDLYVSITPKQIGSLLLVEATMDVRTSAANDGGQMYFYKNINGSGDIFVNGSTSFCWASANEHRKQIVDARVTTTSLDNIKFQIYGETWTGGLIYFNYQSLGSGVLQESLCKFTITEIAQ